MSPNDLTSLLRRTRPGHPERTPACPGEEQIAAYVDGTIEPEARDPLELHLADCDACIVLVGLLTRERDTVDFEPVPELTIARARKLVNPSPGDGQPRRWPRYAPHWAAAATVVLALSAVIHLSQLPGPGGEAQTRPAERTTRGISSSTSALQVLYPSAGMTVDPRQVVFRWEAIPGSRYYEVRIVTEAGDVVTEQRVMDTEWRPAGDLNLSPGVEYFVHVDAYPSEAKTIGSEHIPFRISGNP